MQDFEWANAKSVDDAVRLLGTPAADFDDTNRPIGGGQDLHTTMKAYIQRPSRVVNLKAIQDFGRIASTDSRITFGAAATLTEIAEHADVIKSLPGLVTAIETVASPQIRNMGTIGGNLGQRPRCWYFRSESVTCLKRGGDACFAKEGENKFHAIFATESPCVITQPSDPAQMLIALGATVIAVGPKGKREIPAGEFFRLPTKEDVKHENVLSADEIITQIVVPISPLAAKSTYIKFKERSSLDFAMASVAAAVDVSGGTIKSARVVLGGVAPIPWQLPKVDEFLAGKPLNEETAVKAAELAVADARPLSQNGYKVPLVKTLVKRALLKLA
ncbi:MAG: xanthine dehydrogenase family protein subunit M [Tepidisphaeraceae bacterium]